MRILLTGATGFLGNNLLRMLLDDQHEVTATVRQNSDMRPLQRLNVEKIECDLADPTTIVQALDGMDLLIHAAAMIQIGWTELDTSRRINVAATRELAQAARLKNIRMIHVSSVDALAAGTTEKPATENDVEPAKPSCSYVISKREAEQAFRREVAQGLDGVIVNPGFMVGPWDWKPSSGQMMLAVAKRFTPLAPAGGCCVVDVRDVACGIISAIQHGESGASYILGGENVSYFELWQRMARICGSRPPFGTLPGGINWTAGKFGDLLGRFLAKEPLVNSAATEMGSLVHWYSSDKAIRDLGYRIGNVDIGLSDAWDWFKAYGYT